MEIIKHTVRILYIVFQGKNLECFILHIHYYPLLTIMASLGVKFVPQNLELTSRGSNSTYSGLTLNPKGPKTTHRAQQTVLNWLSQIPKLTPKV